jgi:hypothetical protein
VESVCTSFSTSPKKLSLDTYIKIYDAIIKPFDRSVVFFLFSWRIHLSFIIMSNVYRYFYVKLRCDNLFSNFYLIISRYIFAYLYCLLFIYTLKFENNNENINFNFICWI